MKKLKYFALIALMMTGMINGISAMQNDHCLTMMAIAKKISKIG
jgi:hypothetical protein